METEIFLNISPKAPLMGLPVIWRAEVTHGDVAKLLGHTLQSNLMDLGGAFASDENQTQGSGRAAIRGCAINTDITLSYKDTSASHSGPENQEG